LSPPSCLLSFIFFLDWAYRPHWSWYSCRLRPSSPSPRRLSLLWARGTRSPSSSTLTFLMEAFFPPSLCCDGHPCLFYFCTLLLWWPNGAGKERDENACTIVLGLIFLRFVTSKSVHLPLPPAEAYRTFTIGRLNCSCSGQKLTSDVSDFLCGFLLDCLRVPSQRWRRFWPPIAAVGGEEQHLS